MSKIRLGAVALDCSDPGTLVAFWSALLGAPIVFESEAFCSVRTVEGLFLAAVRIEDHVPPTWPAGERPKQIHLDLAVDDLDLAQVDAVALGAVVEADQPAPERYRVLRDPAGHPFCLSTQIPD